MLVTALSRRKLAALRYHRAIMELDSLAARLGDHLLARGLMAATAESCTGGWIAKCLTDIPGSSAWFDRGFVTYSNAAKRDMLGVPGQLLEKHGAVSETVARAMAEGAARNSAAAITVAVTGIAGPGGGSADKPVGTVWFAWWMSGDIRSECRQFPGERDAVRRATVEHALARLLDWMEDD